MSVLSAAFTPQGALICGNGKGILGVWKDLSAQKSADSSSGGRVEAHCGPIYDIAFPQSGIMATAGDEDIRIWDVKGIVDSSDGNIQGSDKKMDPVKPKAVLRNPQASGSRGFVTPAFETNALATLGETMFAASGDGNIYAWDTNTGKQTQTLQGHSEIVHCLSACGSSLLCSGSEDGTVRGWDPRTSSQVFALNPLTGTEFAHEDEKKGSWIGCLCSDDSGSWMACGGGDRYVALWHVGSRRIITTMPTAGTPQAVVMFEDRVISGGNQSYVFHWSKSGELMGRAACKSKSVFSLAVNRAKSPHQLVAAGLTCIDLFVNHKTLCRSWGMSDEEM